LGQISVGVAAASAQVRIGYSGQILAERTTADWITVVVMAE